MQFRQTGPADRGNRVADASSIASCEARIASASGRGPVWVRGGKTLSEYMLSE
jgi:hypothetical protein